MVPGRYARICGVPRLTDGRSGRHLCRGARDLANLSAPLALLHPGSRRPGSLEQPRTAHDSADARSLGPARVAARTLTPTAWATTVPRPSSERVMAPPWAREGAPATLARLLS